MIGSSAKSRLLWGMGGVALGAAGAGAFLTWKHEIPLWVDGQAVSAAYNCLLLLFAFGSGLTLYSLLPLARRRTEPRTGGLVEWAPAGVAAFLTAIAGSLVAVNLFDFLLKWFVQFEYRKVMPLFDVAKEGNLPTLFSTALLLACAALLGAIAVDAGRRGQGSRYWIGLSAILAFLALDEFAGLHEASNAIVRRSLPGLRAFGREWILLYGLMVVPIGLVYLPFLRQLRPKTRRSTLIAALLALSGALGLEGLSGWSRIAVTRAAWLDFLLSVGEEALEMAGVIVLVYGLLEFMEHRGIELRVGGVRGR